MPSNCRQRRKVYYMPGSKCFALKAKHLRGRRFQDEICVIAPKNLQRPLVYMKYIDIGTVREKKPPYPATRVQGDLNEIDVLNQLTKPKKGARGITAPGMGFPGATGTASLLADPDNIPYCLREDVFIDLGGKFLRAPKELLMNRDYKTRTVYLEEPWKLGVDSLLDSAIVLQKMYSMAGRVIAGIASGLAVTELLLIMIFMTRYDYEHFYDYYIIYSVMTNYLCDYFYIFLTLIIIALLDWMDVGHADFRHISDTIKYRYTWVILLFFLCAFFSTLWFDYLRDRIALSYENNIAQGISRLEVETDQELIDTIDRWNTTAFVKHTFMIIGFIATIVTINDDLFVLHLISIKKYDRPDTTKLYAEPYFIEHP